jgi:LPS-assembly lipoprotein
MSVQRALPRLFLLFVILGMTACGFKLRGTTELPPALQQMTAEGVAPYSELGVALERAWRQSGATLKFERAERSEMIRLQITQNEFTRHTLSVDSAGRPNEFDLRYQVAFKVQDAAGKSLLNNQTVKANRSFRFNPTNILAMDEEEARLKKILAEEIALQIQRRVTFQLQQLSIEDPAVTMDSEMTSESHDETAR